MTGRQTDSDITYGLSCTCEKFGLVRRTGGPKWYENCPIHRTRPETTLPGVEPDLVRKLKTAGQKVGEWTHERDRLIKEAREEGGSLREIAELVGLSHQAVKFICEGRPPR